jgi:hypothetical protein
LVSVVEARTSQLFEIAMERDDLPDEPSHGSNDPPTIEDDRDGWRGDDAHIEWAAMGFLLGALYVYIVWCITDWVRRR